MISKLCPERISNGKFAVSLLRIEQQMGCDSKFNDQVFF